MVLRLAPFWRKTIGKRVQEKHRKILCDRYITKRSNSLYEVLESNLLEMPVNEKAFITQPVMFLLEYGNAPLRWQVSRMRGTCLIYRLKKRNCIMNGARLFLRNAHLIAGRAQFRKIGFSSG